jgi:hypothetical protein
LGHVAQKHHSHFPRSSSFDDFDQRPPRYNISIRNIHFSSCVAGRERASTALLKKRAPHSWRTYCKKGLLRLGQNDRFSDEWSTFYSKLVERPEKTAIGKACLTMFTGIDSILAMGNG